MTETASGAQSTDVVDILTADHKDMLALLGQIEGTADETQRRDLADTVIAEVMRHAVAEEMYVYPVMEEHLPNGKEEVEHDKKEHDEIVQVMKRMEDVSASDSRFMELVRELEAQLRHHAGDEETEQFPKLRANIPREKLVELGEKVETAKKLAPTRPHPSAPHSELFHKTLGPGVGLVDRLRDKLTGRHTG
ncbi:hemerythrin domain-containing protein [Georgenia thermotolerans]|uniref:Hemerythrin domain-containing protein n=1 Tax=Georgenia thermotolerans TaxID=527326 RepID=A0A7J5UTY3_9MICO|nr:hemerythrin domain-containing protein [Georgenia thermotolerans]KAE8765747.1 hemerythrin domain-containing protein [Georgenia thermotolerans]